jgi:hypothetical protein
MTTTHTGQGFAIPKGETYTAPGQAELNRRAAQREADAKQARRDVLFETEESERRTLALAAANKAKILEYRRLGGTRHLPPLEWGPEWDPDDDPFVGLPNNGYARRGDGTV